jgi:hypothetical protein
MFLQTIKIQHQQFFSTLDLITHLALNNHQFPITYDYNLCPQQILQPTLPKKNYLTPIPSSYASSLDFLGLALKQEY